ncbi:MAG: cytidine deaminase [Chloroflexi bacterium]|nr:cytidine deaminase [Chloroflexota bacterium]
MKQVSPKPVHIDSEQLIAAAQAARENAYAPYSDYTVGAAVLGANGTVYTGCNVENASYPASICAERVAITRAVAEGERTFLALAIVTANGGSPCGICRQVMIEFAPEMRVFIAAGDKLIRETKASALLPDSFDPSTLA